jgi:DOPA 4,5-dioxygenase
MAPRLSRRIIADRPTLHDNGEKIMTDATKESIRIDGYHAHVYFDPATRANAAQLRETITGALGVECRELSDEPRGPHPVPQFRFTFTNAQFQTVVPWLMLNRDGLDVLVHPLTDNSYDDHSCYAVWLGNPVALRLNTMRRGYRPEQYPTPR